MNPMNPWVLHVRDTTLKEGKSLTLAEMLERFGKPEGNVPASNRLTTAAKAGYFEKVGRYKDATYKPLPKKQDSRAFMTPEQKVEFALLYEKEGRKACCAKYDIRKDYAWRLASELGLRAPGGRPNPQPKVKGKFVKTQKPKVDTRDGLPVVASIWHLAKVCEKEAV